MHTTIETQGKPVDVLTTKEADAILSSRALPLMVEMELLLSSLLSKKVKFLAEKNKTDSSVPVDEKLSIRFRPVMIQGCVGNQLKSCTLEDIPMVKVSPYIPNWLRIDFRFCHSFGEFGYSDSIAA